MLLLLLPQDTLAASAAAAASRHAGDGGGGGEGGGRGGSGWVRWVSAPSAVFDSSDRHRSNKAKQMSGFQTQLGGGWSFCEDAAP